MICDGITWPRCPRKHEVCHLVTSVSVDLLLVSGGLSNILWPGCSQVLDADVIFLVKGKGVPASGSLVLQESLHKG